MLPMINGKNGGLGLVSLSMPKCSKIEVWAGCLQAYHLSHTINQQVGKEHLRMNMDEHLQI
jgi:hypothetical protein